MASESRDLTRTTLAVLFIGGLIVASFAVVRPFLPAAVWRRPWSSRPGR
jgi:hypothetical protein